ncbi:uncharacterized [Tachysurus ichikawai]
MFTPIASDVIANTVYYIQHPAGTAASHNAFPRTVSSVECWGSNDQHPTPPPYPYLRPSYASWMLRAFAGTAARLHHLPPFTLHAPDLAISSYEEADADPAARWAHDSSHKQPQAQLASRCGAV